MKYLKFVEENKIKFVLIILTFSAGIAFANTFHQTIVSPDSFITLPTSSVKLPIGIFPPSSTIMPELPQTLSTDSEVVMPSSNSPPPDPTITPVMSTTMAVMGLVILPFTLTPVTGVMNPITGISSTLQLDSDGDGVPDNMDQCPGFDDNLDADNDGIPDACDPNTEITTNTVAVDTTLGGNLTVDGASFTIPSGITVEFDFINNKIIIKNPGGKILIEFGGKIT